MSDNEKILLEYYRQADETTQGLIITMARIFSQSSNGTFKYNFITRDKHDTD